MSELGRDIELDGRVDDAVIKDWLSQCPDCGAAHLQDVDDVAVDHLGAYVPITRREGGLVRTDYEWELYCTECHSTFDLRDAVVRGVFTDLHGE